MDGCKIIFSVIIPPIGVFMHTGFSMQLLVNILLTFLGYLPGLVHAVWIIASKR